MKRKLLTDMVGGGADGFIGAPHQIAAGLDRKIDFLADRIQGMSFLAAAVESAKKGSVWTRLT